MAGLRQFAACAGFAALTAFAAVHAAHAQWFPPLGAAPPGEIVQRLNAEGYVVILPLRRNQTVYLADVTSGSDGRKRERLVIDAWSGEVLQRFVARRGSGRRGGVEGYVVEGGEFSTPPPLGPPPERFFREGNFAYGEPGGPTEPAPRWRVKPRPAATASRPAEQNPAAAAAPPAQPVNPPGGNGNSANPPGASAAVAPTGAPSAPTDSAKPQTNGPTKAETSPPASTQPAQEAAPKPDVAPASSPPMAQTQTNNAAKSSGPPPPPPAPAPAAKPGDKSKVNDLPVNPLE